MDINKEIFKRYKPEKKIEIISQLNARDTMNTSYDTIMKMVKEVGIGSANQKRSKYKTLHLLDKVGNNWNSTVTSVYMEKTKNSSCDLVLNVYIQGDDTDTDCSYPLKTFLSAENSDCICARITETFRDGCSKTSVARYTLPDRVRVVKDILQTYVSLKKIRNEQRRNKES